MRLRRPRTDKRSWSRRLADEESREFVERELEDTREVFRTSSGEFQLKSLCRDVFASGATTDLRWLKSRGVDPDAFYSAELAPNWEGLSQEERAWFPVTLPDQRNWTAVTDWSVRVAAEVVERSTLARTQ